QAEFRDAGGRAYVVSNKTECKKSYEVEETAEGDLLIQFQWTGIDLGEEKEVVDVQATVKVRREDPLSYWRIKLANRSKKAGLWRLTFPILENIGPTQGEDLSRDTLILPWGFGRLFHTYDIKNRIELTYPCGWNFSMQFMAYTHEESGLYFATHDPKAYYKRFVFEPDTYSGTLVEHLPSSSFKLINFPEGMGTIQQAYEMPHDAVVGIFKGDWYDAAQLYRSWVLENAEWCKQGSLRKRNDVSESFRKVAIWLLPGNGTDGDPEKVVPQVLKFKEFFGVPVALHWYNWHKIPFDTDYPEYFPAKEGFKEAVKRLQKEGVKVMPYINGRIFDINCKTWRMDDAEKYCAKESAPRINASTLQNYIEVYGSGQKMVVMCPYTEYWQNKIAQIVTKLVEEFGVDGVYIDQVAAAEAKLCFDKTHGHPLGGGCYWVEGYHKLLEKARSNAKAKKYDAFLTSECNAECFINYLDGFLTWHSFQGDLVPIFPAVYGGWALTFGRTFSKEDLENPISFAAKVGQMFIFGAQLGWFSLYELTEEKYQKEAEYLKKLAKYRLLGLKFFESRMMRPPKPAAPIPEVTLLWKFIGSSVKTTIPLVMSSIWKAEDGSLGVFITNISSIPQLVAYNINLEDYGFSKGRKYVVSKVTEAGVQKLYETESTNINLKEILPERSVVLLQVEEAK
ncbi:MAG: DUF6259 domain-containing protein, partial [Thermoproteota archaeon]